MITTFLLMLACAGEADQPTAAPSPAPQPAAAAPGAAAPPAPAAAAASSGEPNVLAGYDGRFKGNPKLSPTQVATIAPSELRAVRNEVYARYGRSFKSEDLQQHFAKTPWYKVEPGFADAWLTANDLANVKLIQSFEGDRTDKLVDIGDFHGEAGQITFLSAGKAELLDGEEDMYNWERESRHFASLGDWVITWEGPATWDPTGKGYSSVQLWELDTELGRVKSVTELETLRG